MSARKEMKLNINEDLTVSEKKMETVFKNYLQTLEDPNQYQLLSDVFMNPTNEKLGAKNKSLDQIRQYLLDSLTAKFMRTLILDKMKSYFYGISYPCNILDCIDDLPRLLAGIAAQISFAKSVCVNLNIDRHWGIDGFQKFTTENLQKLSTVMRAMDVQSALLEFYFNDKFVKILSNETERAAFLNIINNAGISFNKMKAGCSTARISYDIPEQIYIELFSTLKVTDLRLGIELNSKRLAALLSGILNSKIRTLSLPACNLHVLKPEEWTALFNVLKTRGIQSFSMTLNNDEPLLFTPELKKAFLDGLKSAAITQLNMEGWGPRYYQLEPTFQEQIKAVLDENNQLTILVNKGLKEACLFQFWRMPHTVKLEHKSKELAVENDILKEGEHYQSEVYFRF